MAGPHGGRVSGQHAARLALHLGRPARPELRGQRRVGGCPLFGIPAAIAIAILKHQLYDIDRIISRTLAYAIVTGLLVGVYAGLVLLATQVLSFSSPVAVAHRPWPPRRCSARCAAGSSRPPTGDSTGPATTPTGR